MRFSYGWAWSSLFLIACTTFSGAEISTNPGENSGAGGLDPGAGQGGSDAGASGSTTGGVGGQAGVGGGGAAGQGGAQGGKLQGGKGGNTTAGEGGSTMAGAGGSTAGQGGSTTAGTGGSTTAGAGQGGGGTSGSCPSPLTQCKDLCVDLQSDPSHCGNCFNVCSQAQCVQGQCVPLGSCGNKKVEPGEECDGDPPRDCVVVVGEGYGEYATCLPSCKWNISTCIYCGNGKRDENEVCEGTDLNNATCASLGAGTGTLSCKSCQFDLSQCSQPVCGTEKFNQALMNGAVWPMEGGCMAQPNQSMMTGVSNPSSPVSYDFDTLPLTQSPAVAADDTGSFYSFDEQIFRWNGVSPEVVGVKISGNQVITSPVLLSGGNLLQISKTHVSLWSRDGSSWSLKKNTNQSGVALSTNILVNNFAYYVRGNGGLSRLNLNSFSEDLLSFSPTGLSGSMAYDITRDTLYAIQSGKSGNSKLYALDLNGQKQLWQLEIGFQSSEDSGPCHVALGSSGMIYTTCGFAVRFIHPDQPTKYNGGYNTSVGAILLAPAIASDGTVYLAHRSSSSVLVASTPQLEQIWVQPLSTIPLAAPLLDREGNVYMCLKDRVVSFNKDGMIRWDSVLTLKANSCSLLFSAAGQLDVITDRQALRFKQ